MHVYNCTFTACITAGVYSLLSADTYVYGTTFRACTAIQGPAAFSVEPDNRLYLYDCHAIDCTASGDGGAYGVSVWGTVEVRGGTISGCRSAGNGGAFHLRGGDFKLWDVEISDCQARQEPDDHLISDIQ